MTPNLYPSGARITDRYEVAGRPLAGGMGIVYLCFDHQEQRPVALKTFKPEYLPNRDARERFLREGATWVALGRHPHIVHAYGVERIYAGSEVYLVLELVAKEEGRKDASLRAWLTPGRPLPVDQVLLIALQIARGMHHATATIPAFVHRDLKPENVLVGADRLSSTLLNRVRVTDFGLVKGLQSEQVSQPQHVATAHSHPGQLTRIGNILGTPHYMAPEQWDSTDVDTQADIYALGCIIGEMLSGHLLVQGGTVNELRRAHQGGEALSTIQPTVPAALQDILAGCLAVKVEKRYRTWDEVEAALSEAYIRVAGQPVPLTETVAALNREDRVAAGWSHCAIGYSYLDVGNAYTSMNYLRRAYAIGEAEQEILLEATCLDALGGVYWSLGDLQQAVQNHRQAINLRREVGKASIVSSPIWLAARQGEGAALSNLGTAYVELGEVELGIQHYVQAVAISREVGDRRGEAQCLNNLSEAYRRLGDPQKAIQYAEEALTIHKELGERFSQGSDLTNLGSAYLRLGNAENALHSYEEALMIYRELGHRRDEGNLLLGMGNVFMHIGDIDQATQHFNGALAIAREVGDRLGESRCLGNLGSIHWKLGNTALAIQYHEQTLVISRDIGNRQGEGHSLSNLSIAYLQLGDIHQAIQCLEQSLAVRQSIGDRLGESHNLANLGDIYLQLGDTEQAQHWFEKALNLYREMGHREGIAAVFFKMARLHAEQGALARGLTLAREAARIWRQIGQTANAERAQQLIIQLEGGGISDVMLTPDDTIHHFAPFIAAAAAAARGDYSAQQQIESVFATLTQKGWQIADSIRRIWAGERDEVALTANLDASDSLVIQAILQQLSV